jgi:hypothetical protein
MIGVVAVGPSRFAHFLVRRFLQQLARERNAFGPEVVLGAITGKLGIVLVSTKT